MHQLDLFPETLQDDVNHPAHYQAGGIETFEFIRAKLTTDELRGYLKGNIIKYLSRANFKRDDDGEQDTLKARWYMEKLAETYLREAA